ncbi:hypothetical protein TOPH_05117 [Tolypocladium ophioglossoides CBS 100239]|uniref:Uncharacterized protein n=1 Tax=Tolypocladium ophioglossoides (strain CBS 100239) TaxID=1163406 RepID=A0A0L0N7V8_TOLOC|nr:hypothetical protein TOPH_05117 [Tolypocladium ophioglossoides CBS 100239]
MKTTGTLALLSAADASLVSASPLEARGMRFRPQPFSWNEAVGIDGVLSNSNSAGPLGGIGNTAADLARGAVDVAGSVAGDIVNAPLDLLGKIQGKRVAEDANEARADAVDDDDEICDEEAKKHPGIASVCKSAGFYIYNNSGHV